MTYRWTTKDLDDLEAFYWTEIAPVMQEDDLDPEADRPPHGWMTEHGFSGVTSSLPYRSPTHRGERLRVGLPCSMTRFADTVEKEVSVETAVSEGVDSALPVPISNFSNPR
jgi:hypothetical protein